MIPCLDEAASIGAVVTAVRNEVERVIVVDDGSSDATAALAEKAGAEVLRHGRPEGKGAALLAGWARARSQRFKWALTLDGDGQHAVGDVPAFFREAEQSGSALVVGNRMNGASQMPWLRRRVNHWMSRRLSAAAGQWLPDSQCGFRLMNLEAWAGLRLVSRHFEIESEVLLAFVQAGHAVSFVPVRTIYKDEQSKINPLRDTVRWFRWWQQVRKAKQRPAKRV